MRQTAALLITICCLCSCEGETTQTTYDDDPTPIININIDFGGTTTPPMQKDMGSQTPVEDMTVTPVPDMSTKVDSSPDLPVEEKTIPVIVAFGWQGVRTLSIDEGKTWCETGIMTDPHDDLFRGGSFHDGLFVGAHAGFENRGAIMTSRNGYEWTAHHRTNFEPDLPENPSGQWYGGVAYGNGMWLAAGGCGKIASSTDGQTWVQMPDFPEGCKPIRSLAFGNGRFVAALDDLGWWESTDGQTWTERDATAGTVVVWDGADFEGGQDSFGTTYFRGRGLCMYGQGWAEQATIMRSENADCSNATAYGSLSGKTMGISYGYAPAEDFEPINLPIALKTCLGL